MIIAPQLKKRYKELSPEAQDEIYTYVNMSIVRIWLLENNITPKDLVKEQKRRIRAKKARRQK